MLVPGGGWNDRSGAGRLRRGAPRRHPQGARRAPRRAAAAIGSASAPARCCSPRRACSAAAPRSPTTPRIEDLRTFGVDVREGERVVDDGDIITAAGVTSGIDLALYLVEQELGAEAAQAGRGRDRMGPQPASKRKGARPLQRGLGSDEGGEGVRAVDRARTSRSPRSRRSARRGTGPRGGGPSSTLKQRSLGRPAEDRPRPRTRAGWGAASSSSDRVDSARRKWAASRTISKLPSAGAAQPATISSRRALGQPAEADRQPPRARDAQRGQERRERQRRAARAEERLEDRGREDLQRVARREDSSRDRPPGAAPAAAAASAPPVSLATTVRSRQALLGDQVRDLVGDADRRQRRPIRHRRAVRAERQRRREAAAIAAAARSTGSHSVPSTSAPWRKSTGGPSEAETNSSIREPYPAQIQPLPQWAPVKRVLILGSTGSIGTQALDVDRTRRRSSSRSSACPPAAATSS